MSSETKEERPKAERPKATEQPKSAKTNVLVTGGCGFIASNFIRRLLATGRYRVVNVDKMYYCASQHNIDRTYDGKSYRDSDLTDYSFYQCDIADSKNVSEILTRHQIQVVYHFAAQSHVDNSFEASRQFVVDNVLGTTTLLETCRQYGRLRLFIHVSTDEVYGDVTNDRMEGVIKYGCLDPTNPYAASKAAAELMVRSYIYSYQMPIIITRSNNVYGPQQYWEKIIPKFIYRLMNGQKVSIYGNGQALRKYLYVDDACDAYLLILEKGQVGQIYEMGSEVEHSALEMAEMLISKLKPGDDCAKWIEYVEDRKFHDSRYLVNSGTLTNLGWRPKTNFSEGLDQTVRWYRDYAIPNRHWSS